jgi:3-oxoacyl-[acyl-carrier-protein] synthase-3
MRLPFTLHAEGALHGAIQSHNIWWKWDSLMAFIRGFGSWLPERRVGNAELAAALECAPEWILEMSGIAERRYAGDAEKVASIGARAAQSCLANAGVAAGEVGLLLVASGSSERFCPGPAGEIALKLGMGATPAIDIPVASAGSLIGLAMAAELAAKFGRVLVVGSEIMSRRILLAPEGRNTAILFGDGAGACLVDREIGGLKIVDSLIATDGASAEILAMENELLRMEGPSVILQAARKLPGVIKDLLSRNSIAADQVEGFLLHQANLNLITRVATSLKVPAERFYTNIQRYGNTSSASMLIAADEWSKAHQVDGPIVFSAFGAGINWGAVLALPV